VDGRYKKGEALGMVNTRRRGIQDECNRKTRMILSQREKQSGTVRKARYYGLLILADEVLRAAEIELENKLDCALLYSPCLSNEN